MTEDKLYYSDGTTSIKRDFNKTLHREEGPAVERENGTKVWYINGKRHRTNGPVLEDVKGDRAWWFNGIPIVFYCANTGNYELYDDYDTVITEEQARLLLAKYGVVL